MYKFWATKIQFSNVIHFCVSIFHASRDAICARQLMPSESRVTIKKKWSKCSNGMILSIFATLYGRALISLSFNACLWPQNTFLKCQRTAKIGENGKLYIVDSTWSDSFEAYNTSWARLYYTNNKKFIIVHDKYSIPYVSWVLINYYFFLEKKKNDKFNGSVRVWVVLKWHKSCDRWKFGTNCVRTSRAWT